MCGFHAPGRWDEIVADGRLPARLRARQRGARAGARLVAARRASAPGTGAPSRASCATSSCARAAAPASCRSGSSPRRARSTLDALAAAVDCEGLFWTRTAGLGESTAGRRDEALIRGAKRLREELGDLEFLISPDAFFQTNTEMAEVLYGVGGRVRRPARPRARLRPLLRDRHDRPELAAARARSSASRSSSGRSPTRSTTRAATRSPTRASSPATSGSRCATSSRSAGKPDVVVIDPPRAGLSQKVVRRIVEAAPKRIVYVSCNPTTLAPNAAQLVEAGYALERVRPVDMFPQTPHIECVALFERA